MKDGGSLELVPSVSVALPAEAERAATMPAEPIGAQTVLQEGTLGRKHDVEGSGKKSSNRSVQRVDQLRSHPALCCSLVFGTIQVPSHTSSSSLQIVEQPVLRLETGSALRLQGRQEFRPWRDLSRRGAVVPRQRPLGDPHQLQKEEARLQAAVSVPV